MADEAASGARWLVLLHQLPSRSANARVKTWRRLQQLGAISLRSSAYVLPNSVQAREDLQWMKSEIVSMGGQATVVAANGLEGATDREIVGAFREARQADYRDFLADLVALEPRAKAAGGKEQRFTTLRRALRGWRGRLSEIAAVDFFSAPGRTEAERALARLESRLALPDPTGRSLAAKPVLRPLEYRGRAWVTRPRPGVDRMASAWLVRRYIDPKAVFRFNERPSTRQVPFDMYEGEFSHHDGRCTFEVLAERFQIDDPVVRRIGEIVHDIDLKDARYGSAEAATIGALVEGLRAVHADDQTALERGIELFEALSRSMRAVRPARAARARPRARRIARANRSRRK